MSRNYGGTMVANVFARFGADTEPFQRQMRAVVTRMLFAAESFTQAGRIMSTAITAPMAMIGFAALKASLAFEESLVKINTLVGVSASIIEGWRDGILRTAIDTGVAATELADAMFFITSNGIKGAEAMEVLKAAGQAAAVGLGETKDVAFAATSAMNAYGQGVMTGAEATAVLVKTVREGNLEAKELPSVLGQVLPVAAAMGVEFHEAGAAIAAMSRSGVSAKLAALGLKSILISIIAPTSGAQKAADALGTSFEKIQQITEERGIFYGLEEITRAADGNQAALKSLIPNQKAFVAALQLMGKNSADTRKIFESLAETVSEDLTDAFKETTKSASFLAKQAKAELGVALIRLGDNLHPLIQKFADFATWAADLAERFDKLSETSKGVVSGFAAFAFGIGPILYGIGSLARMTARFIGLSILFKARWVENTAEMMIAEKQAQKTSLAMKGLSSNTAMVGFSLLAAFTAGYQFGKFLDEWLGYTDLMNKTYATYRQTWATIGDVYKKNTGLMKDNAVQAAKLAVKIGETDLASKLLAASQEGNSRAASDLISTIGQLAHAYNEKNKIVVASTEAEDKHAKMMGVVQDEIMARRDAQIKANAETQKEYDLLTGPEVQTALDGLIEKRKQMLKMNIDESLMNEAMGADLLKYLKLAKEYNLTLSDDMVSWSKQMQTEGIPGFEKLDDLLSRTFTKVNAQPGTIIEGMVKIGDKTAEHLSRGFGQGFDTAGIRLTALGAELRGVLMGNIAGGFNMGMEQFPAKVSEMAEKIKLMGIKIPVYPDEEIWIKFFNDLADGRYPDTGG